MLPYDEAGEGSAMVLLHAGIADRSMWSEQLEPLAEAGYRVVAPDLPGFGDAPIAAGEQAPWSDVLGLMDELEIERAVLVGNSFGGAVALRVAVLAGERVTALVLVSAPAPGLDPSAQLQAAWKAEEAGLDRGDLESAVSAVVNAWTLPDAPTELRERVATMQRRAFARQAAAGEVSEAPDPVEADPDLLGGLDMPALVTAGELDMPDFRRSLRSLASVLPQARSALIAGAAHLAPLERPSEFRALLLSFLREVAT
ncbi:MAG TPA: alpha/beta hydrolase [Solirubrobacteraceae bacterium]|nr:alpha/beta hydrolase [Solirubrobacteraceae bacterium]